MVMALFVALVAGACNVETVPATASEKPAPAAEGPVLATPKPTEGAERNERLVPTIADGAFIGFKVFAIQPESRYAKAGFQDGDLIVAIDGEAITKAEDGATIDAGLAKNEVVQLTVSRKGFKLPRPLTLKK